MSHHAKKLRPPAMWETEGRAFALSHPARVQVDAPNGRQMPPVPAGGGEFNIWYGKYCHNREFRQDFGRKKTQREYRCDAIADCGRTRGYDQNSNYFCYHFAKGQCAYGEGCTFLHLIPTAEDCAAHEKNPEKDVFGRDRYAEEKQSRGGIGSFMSVTKTLYVGFGAATERLGTAAHQAVEDAFHEWGPIEDVYVLRGKNVAFVRFAFRATAEFAKEAMSNQRIDADSDGSEVLNVRWANDDPNPAAVRRLKRNHEEMYVDALERDDAATLAPEHRASAALARSLAGGEGEDGQSAAYPSTDHLYSGGYAVEPGSALTAPMMPPTLAAGAQGGLARVSTPGFSHGGAAAAAFPPAPENSTVMADYKRHAAYWASVLGGGIEEEAPAVMASDGHVYAIPDEDESDDEPPPPPPKPATAGAQQQIPQPAAARAAEAGGAGPSGAQSVADGQQQHQHQGEAASAAREKHWDEYTPEEQAQWLAYYHAAHSSSAGAAAAEGAEAAGAAAPEAARAEPEAGSGVPEQGPAGPAGLLALLGGYGSGGEASDSEEQGQEQEQGGQRSGAANPSGRRTAAFGAAPAPYQGGLAATWRTHADGGGAGAVELSGGGDDHGAGSGEALSGAAGDDVTGPPVASGKGSRGGGSAQELGSKGDDGRDEKEEEEFGSFIPL